LFVVLFAANGEFRELQAREKKEMKYKKTKTLALPSSAKYTLELHDLNMTQFLSQ